MSPSESCTYCGSALSWDVVEDETGVFCQPWCRLKSRATPPDTKETD